MFGNEHKGHDFTRLNKLYNEHILLLRAEQNNLLTRLDQLSLIEQSIETRIRLLKTAKEEKFSEYTNYFQDCEIRLNSLLKEQMSLLLTHKNDILKECSLLDHLNEELNHLTDEKLCPRNTLITKTKQIQTMMKEVKQNFCLLFFISISLCIYIYIYILFL
jgi:hypothetical protein